MAAKADIEAGRAHIMLYLKNSPLIKGLDSVKKSMGDFGGSIVKMGAAMTAAGAAVIAPITAALMHFSNAGDQLDKMSARTGIAGSSLAELGFAAEQSGTSLEEIEKSARKMQKTIVDAGNGSSAAVDALATLGLTAQQLARLSPEDQFQTIAERLGAIPDPTRKAATAMEVFGKSGTALLPMLNDLKSLREEARKRGLVPSDEAIKNAAAINDAFGRIRRTGLAVTFEIAAAFAPILMPALEAVANVATATVHWVKQNGALVRSVLLIGAAIFGTLGAVGAILTSVGAGFVGVGAVIGGVMTTLTAIGGAVAFLLSPLGLTIAAVVAVGAALVAGVVAWARFTESGKSAVAFLMGRLGEFLTFGREVIGGIGDALMAGDLALAAQIGWQAVLVVFETFKLQAMNVWFSLRDSLIDGWGEVTLALQTGIAFVAKIFTGLLDQLVPGWQAGMALIAAAITTAFTTFQTTAMGAISAIRVGLDGLISRVKSFVTGLQVATKVTVATAPEVFDKGNEEVKKFLGIDVGKLFGDANDEAAKQNAAGREKLNDNKAERQAGNATARSDQANAIAASQAKLDALRKEAANAAADARRNVLPARPVVLDQLDKSSSAGKASFVTFSAAALAAQGGGASDKKLKVAEAQLGLQKQALKEAEKTRQRIDALQLLATA